MKNLTVLLTTLIFFGTSISMAQLSENEREFAINEMTKTQEHLLNSLDGLSEAQLNYKVTPESWSIAECMEHIAISETNIFGLLQGSIQTEADPTKQAEVKTSDDALLKLMVDRSNKVKTSEAFEPSGKYGSHEKTVDDFLKNRKDNIEFVGNTEADLRNHYADLPFGTIDAYQILLFMSGHTERHVLQIEEVMNDESFPSS